jgi:diguanylate cyclase (GGDEF)-like protein/PAS domain S-box-containing protein
VPPPDPGINYMKLADLLPKTLRTRLALAISTLLFVAIALVISFMTLQDARSQFNAQQRLARNLMDLALPTVRRLLRENANNELQSYLGTLAQDPAVGQLLVSDANGSVRFRVERGVEPAGTLTRLLVAGSRDPIRYTREIQDGKRGIGQLILGVSYRPLNENILLFVSSSIVMSLLFMALTLYVAMSILRRFTAPLEPLTRHAREYARGNFPREIELIDSGSRELQELNRAFADGAQTMHHYIHRLEETRELLENSETRLRTLINGMHEVLFELDIEGHISFINPAWQTITGFAIDDALGRPFTEFLDGDAASMFERGRLNRLHQKNHEILVKTVNGDTVWANLDAHAQFDSTGQFTGVIGTLGDITESVELNRMLGRYQEELYHLSVTDPLTGLYNRRHFDTQFQIILSDHLKQNQSLCLMLIDIDGFKFINDTYGHPFGDEVLKKVAALLRELVRRNDYIARLAGDEFAMVLKHTNLKDATRVAHKLHDSINEAVIDLPVGHIKIQTSVGVAEAPTHGTTTQDLVSAADVALYQSKRAGRNRVQILAPDTSQATMSIFGQGFALRNALDVGNLIPAFQPIFDLASGKPIAYEVLARMRVNDEIVPAAEFITIAEELGLTREIDLFIIEQALLQTPCAQRLFVNVDLSSFNDSSFIRRLRDLLRPACEVGRDVTIEITERESLPITAELKSDIAELRSIGCRLALDDFGSGYSTYKFLDQFRPDYLKIEGAFVQRMLESSSARRIVTHIHELANSFGIQTIAENIENPETLEILKSIGIHNGQGILLGAPEFLPLSAERSRRA